MTDRSQIDEIKSKLDIVNVVQEYLPNLRHSGRNHFALCPFHSEKSPSFSVNEEIQRYKCFGCGESGDVINFIEKMEGIEFPKALEIAAKKAGVTLRQNNNPQFSAEYKNKEKIYEANRLTAEFFHYILMKHQLGETGRTYANKRKLGKQQIQDFMIGYAPEGFENLKKYLEKKGYASKDLVSWSLLVEKNGKIYDKFRKRLMFPIFNHVGDIVGFSGRVIDNNDIPKYLNSSETAVYHKSEIVYGLYQGKDSIRKSRTAILVEGNVDVPMAHKFDVKNIVAPMGTALTKQQLKLVKRYADTIIFSFDSDLAGEKALAKGFELAEKIGLNSKAIDTGEFKDLDELINHNPDNLQKVINNASPVIDNLIKRYSNRINLAEAKGKTELVKLITPYIKLINEKIEQTHYVQQLAKIVNTNEALIWDIVRGVTPKANPIPLPEKPKPVRKIDDALSHAEHLIALVLQHRFLQDFEFNLDILDDEDLVIIYSALVTADSYEKGMSELSNEQKNVATSLIMHNLGSFESDHEIELLFEKEVDNLTKKFYKRRLNEIKIEKQRREAADLNYDDLMLEESTIIKKLK